MTTLVTVYQFIAWDAATQRDEIDERWATAVAIKLLGHRRIEASAELVDAWHIDEQGFYVPPPASHKATND